MKKRKIRFVTVTFFVKNESFSNLISLLHEIRRNLVKINHLCNSRQTQHLMLFLSKPMAKYI